MVKTTYRVQFGEPPRAAEDFNVMKSKRFRELEISKFFKSDIVSGIETWLNNNPADNQVSQIYFTCRNLHTFIKQHEVPNTTHNHFYTPKKIVDRAPRFDQIIAQNKKMFQPKKNSTASTGPSGRQLIDELVKSKMNLNKPNATGSTFGGSSNGQMWSAAKIGQKMMRGQPYNILAMVHSTDPNRSDYQTTFQGLQNA